MGFCLAHTFLDARAPTLSESQILFSWERNQRHSRKSEKREREVGDADVFSCSTPLEALSVGATMWVRKSAGLGLEFLVLHSPAG